VLVFNLNTDNSIATASGGHTADNVLGEPDFVTTYQGQGAQANDMTNPEGLAFDSANNRLFVVDSYIQRVTIYNTRSITNGMNASSVLGAADLTSPGGGCSQKLVSAPNDAAFDSTNNRLFVADSGNNRVLVFSTDVTSGLLGWWKFDDGSGASAIDSSGNGNTGTLQGTPTWTTSGKVNGAITFNGSNGNDVKITGLLGNPAAVTLAAWANLSADGSIGSEVISLGDIVNLRLDDGSTQTDAAYQYAAGAWETIAYPHVYAGTGWHHFAVVINPAASSEVLYVDGAQVASQTLSNAIDYSGLGTDTYIGRHGNGDNGYNFNGTIDDARVYNRALSASEIATLYLSSEKAANVLGQSSFTACTANRGSTTKQNSMSNPVGVAYDPVNNRLFVADDGNHRMLVFNTSSITNGMNASFVLGEPDFVTNSGGVTTQNGMNLHIFGINPLLTYDPGSGRLFVGDYNNNRIMIFESTYGAGGPSPFTPGYD
jgi:DNA-binding beta-propeller fold protein YncE